MMMKLINYKEHPSTNFDAVLDDIEKICKAYQEDTQIRSVILEKVGNPFTTAFLMEENGQITGLIYLEKHQPHYGNLLVHATNDEILKSLIGHFITQNPQEETVVELTHFRDDFVIQDILIEYGLLEKERQRMVYAIPDDFEKPRFPSELSLEPITHENKQYVGEISSKAHSIRQNIEGYKDFESAENRIEMETLLLNETFNTYLKQASLLLKHHKEYIGSCSTVVIENWDKSQIAWIMDVCIKPEYQGFGYARKLINEVIYQTKAAGIHDIGLGVTLSNKTAVSLYTNMGFVRREYFVEFLWR